MDSLDRARGDLRDVIANAVASLHALRAHLDDTVLARVETIRSCTYDRALDAKAEEFAAEVLAVGDQLDRIRTELVRWGGSL